MEPSVRTNGLKVRSYGDLVAVATLLSMFLGVVAWGLKLESELNTLRDNYGVRIATLEARTAQMHPRTDERINALRRDLDHLSEEFDEHDNHQ